MVKTLAGDTLPIFAFWETLLDDLLTRTQKFPKSVRFTLTNRIDNLAVDVLELLIRAQYSQNKLVDLQQISIFIDTLRVLIRLCHKRAYIDHNGYEHVVRGLDEAGRMLGGWIKQQARR